MEQRQDQQAAIGGRQAQCLGDHADHRGEVGVIEHDALGLAGRAARVDEQRQGVRRGLRQGAAADRRRGERRHVDRRHIDHRHIGDIELGALVEEHAADESSIWNAASPAVRLGLIGVSAAPTRQAANMTTTSSTRFVNMVATTSPAPTPLARSIAAVALTRARNSAFVSASRSSSMHGPVGSSAARSSGRVANVVVGVMGATYGQVPVAASGRGDEPAGLVCAGRPRNVAIRSATGSACCMRSRCPAPGTISSSAFGIRPARMRALIGGTIGSAAPLSTRVGCPDAMQPREARPPDPGRQLAEVAPHARGTGPAGVGLVA